MFEMVQLLAATNLFVLAFSVLIFDIPRYTLSLLSLTSSACADEATERLRGKFRSA